MVKDYIKYEGKEYQLSTVLLYDCEFETMIFPIENGVVSGSEVYKFTTFKASESQRKHKDILDKFHNMKNLSVSELKDLYRKAVDLSDTGYKFNEEIDKFKNV